MITTAARFQFFLRDDVFVNASGVIQNRCIGIGALERNYPSAGEQNTSPLGHDIPSRRRILQKWTQPIHVINRDILLDPGRIGHMLALCSLLNERCKFMPIAYIGIIVSPGIFNGILHGISSSMPSSITSLRLALGPKRHQEYIK